ncbi:hypothetical protein [Thermococcus sp. LS2]|uniref:hypothetical protein n=1 Tax=Thermococcus sp. LS2 TaxID=1638260 RepID=UPI001438B6C6|nr:hypothetical protein [Thermococcus sp. LS2]NJE13351.1 hypothetical protein [Thermococcus sp. LS2]
MTVSDKLVINFEKTFYAIENEISEAIRDWANTAVVISKAQLTPVKAREVRLIEYYGEIREHKILKSMLDT